MEEEDVANSYDKNFLNNINSDFKKFNTPRNKRLANSNGFDAEEHRVDFNSSNQDEVDQGVNPFLNQAVNLNAEDPYNEIRASNQSPLEQIGLGLTRAAVKGLAEIGKLPGVVGGLIHAGIDETSDLISNENDHKNSIDTAFNNPWIEQWMNLMIKLTIIYYLFMLQKQ